MKLIWKLAVALILLFYSIVGVGQHPDNLQFEVLKLHKVKTVLEYEAISSKGIILDSFIIVGKKTVNEFGNSTVVLTYDLKGNVVETKKIKYFKDTLIKECFVKNLVDNYTKRTRYKYNKQLLNTKNTISINGQITSQTSFKYNKLGKIVESTNHHYRLGRISHSSDAEYKYENQGRNEIIIFLNRASSLELVYDDNHNLIEEYDVQGDYQKKLIMKNEYDERNNLLQTTHFYYGNQINFLTKTSRKMKTGEFQMTKYDYLSNGLLNSEKVFLNQDLISIKKYAYEY